MLTVLLATGQHFRVSLVRDDNNYIYIHLFFTVLVSTPHYHSILIVQEKS